MENLAPRESEFLGDYIPERAVYFRLMKPAALTTLNDIQAGLEAK